MSSEEKNWKVPFNIPLVLTKNRAYIEKVIKSQLVARDGQDILDSAKFLIIIDSLIGIGNHSATATISDNFGNTKTAYLNLKVRDDIPTAVIVDNAYLINAPDLPIITLSDIAESIKATAPQSVYPPNPPGKSFKELVLTAESLADYENYQANAKKIGVYQFRYKARIGLEDDDSQDEIVDRLLQIKVLATSGVDPNPNQSWWEQMKKFISENAYWFWPTSITIIVAIIALIVWSIVRKKVVYLDKNGNPIKPQKKSKPTPRKRLNKKKRN